MSIRARNGSFSVGDTSNIVFDTRTTSLGIGVTGSNDPSSNLYITGNAYVSSNLAIGGVMTMGVVNVAARHNLQAVTDMGNVTTHTVEFTNPTTSIVASGNVEVGGSILGYATKISATSPSGTESSFAYGSENYKLHTFTSDGTFTVTASGIVEYLVVAGGGGGGSGQGNGGGHAGGGGGGVLTGTTWVPVGNHVVTVGDRGNGGAYNGNPGSNGDNSSFMGQVAFGGGGGEGTGTATRGLNGGSGGGGGSPAYNLGKGFGLLPQGADGADGSHIVNYTSGSNLHRGGGGGGAGRSPGMPATPNACPGGDGRPCSISGSQVYYGGGGGASGIAGSYATPINTGGAGGLGGGGNGGISPGPTTASSTPGTAGTSNTGGGGGGGGYGKDGGAGGSGIVIIRYLI